MFISSIKRFLNSEGSSSTFSVAPPHTEASPVKLNTQAFQPQEPSRILSLLPLEIRLKIYALLLCPSGEIYLRYDWYYLNAPHLRSMQQGPWQQWIDPNILLSNKQIHAEASDVLYGQASLHPLCDSSLHLPSPGWPLQGFGKPMRNPNKEGDQLSPEVFRRFKKIKLTVFVAPFDDAEVDRRSIYPYTLSETRADLRGLKDVLGALAVSGMQSDANGALDNEPSKLKILNLRLKWRSYSKRCTADEFEKLWKKEGVWDLLGQIAKIRIIEFSGVAQRDFDRQWL